VPPQDLLLPLGGADAARRRPWGRSLHAVALACASVACGAAAAQDRADIDRSQIVGNRELPKVLYIVPWKKPLPGELSGRPVNSVLDEALASIDRDVFRRQLRYDQQLQPPAASPPK
jgi:hypothetical protein